MLEYKFYFTNLFKWVQINKANSSVEKNNKPKNHLLKETSHQDSIENIFFDLDISKKPNCQERKREWDRVPPSSLCFHTELLHRKHFTHDAQRGGMRYQIKGRRKLGNVEMLEDLASRGHRMDVNGRKGKREKSFNGLSARPASCSSFSLSLFLPSLSPPLPFSSSFRRLDPHRYLDGRTNAANRKPNNLGHFWQTMPSKCNSNALTHLLDRPRLEFQVVANLTRDPSATISPSLLIWIFSSFAVFAYASSSPTAPVSTVARFDKRTWLAHASLPSSILSFPIPICPVIVDFHSI